MAEFRVHRGGEIEALYDRRVGFRTITTEALQSFWSECGMGDGHGVYVFSMRRRGPGAPMPFYVGKASRTTFSTETFNPRNRRAYTASLLESEGTPTIDFLVLQRTRGPINHQAIDDLETLMIWIARHRNQALVNRRKINTSPSHLMALFASNRVVGVLNSGQGNISETAQAFRDMMAL